MDHLWERYTPASRRLVEALFNETEPAADDLLTVRHTLSVYLAGLGADTESQADVLQDTFVQLISAIQRGAVDRESNVAAFVRTIAHNCWRDLGRYRSRRPVLDPTKMPEPINDDEVARLLDKLSSAASVGRALARASAEGEVELAAFVSDWLRVADRFGGTPSLRETAQALGTNHVHVQRQLSRFEPFLRD